MQSYIKSNNKSFYNIKVFNYPNGMQKIIHYSFLVSVGNEKPFTSKKGSNDLKKFWRSTYLNRVRSKIFDYALSNKFEYFITLTFNPEIVNSFDYLEVSNALKKWLNNQRHKCPNMGYLLVPELHKSGRIHFHGLVFGVDRWTLVNSGRRSKGDIIYNLADYNLGFTTITLIKDDTAVSNYVSKYVTKDLLDIKNRKHYWVSKNLLLPTIEYYTGSVDKLQNINNESHFSNGNYTIDYYLLNKS